MRVSDFHFELPEELIAQHPPEVRGESRMLVLDRGGGGLRDAMFRDLPGLLRRGDLLVLNDSRVLPARLFATRAGLGRQTGSPQPDGVVEVLLTERVEEFGSSAPTTQNRDVGHREPGCSGENVWRALVRPAKKVRVGETLYFRAAAAADSVLTAEVVGAGERGERTLRFAPVDDFYARVAEIGHMPLPPYIRRDQAGKADSAEDRERYQTVYAREMGSAAAPTAGLHFTPEVLAELAAAGVEIAYVTLHVGLGTFQPVRVAELADIRLHSERYTLAEATAQALNRALADGRRVVAVGTTTTRVLEHVGGLGRIAAHSGETAIFIAPGHRFRVVGGLVTNFHLPESTLLMLVCAFAANSGDTGEAEAGRRAVLEAYAHAVRAQYRFYSYGDCMLLV